MSASEGSTGPSRAGSAAAHRAITAHAPHASRPKARSAALRSAAPVFAQSKDDLSAGFGDAPLRTSAPVKGVRAQPQSAPATQRDAAGCGVDQMGAIGSPLDSSSQHAPAGAAQSVSSLNAISSSGGRDINAVTGDHTADAAQRVAGRSASASRRDLDAAAASSLASDEGPCPTTSSVCPAAQSKSCARAEEFSKAQRAAP